MAKRKEKKRLKIWLQKKRKQKWQKFGTIRNFQKNEDFWRKSRYLLKISRALHIKSHKKKATKLSKNYVAK